MKDIREQEKRLAAQKAAEYIQDGMILGLGSGSTSHYLIQQAGRLLRPGISFQAVASSQESARLAREQGIEVLDINDVDRIDLAVDGVDEIDPDFNAVKGGGGALFREKIIASLATELIWIMDSSKVVSALGAYPLPVEILPFSYKHTLAALEKDKLHPRLRMRGNEIYMTDNGNYIADLMLTPPLDTDRLRSKLRARIGVLEDGLFLNMCTRIVVARGDTVEVRENPNKQTSPEAGLG